MRQNWDNIVIVNCQKFCPTIQTMAAIPLIFLKALLVTLQGGWLFGNMWYYSNIFVIKISDLSSINFAGLNKIKPYGLTVLSMNSFSIAHSSTIHNITASPQNMIRQDQVLQYFPFCKSIEYFKQLFSCCNIYTLLSLQFPVFIKQDSKARSCVAGISNSVTLPENDRFSF